MNAGVIEGRTRRISSWIVVCLWALLTVVLTLAVRSLPWQRTIDQVKHVAPLWLVAAVIANVIPMLIWAFEWRLLSPGVVHLAYSRAFEIVTVMAAVLNSVPLFAGEASGIAMLIARGGLSRGAALSVLAMDQLLNGLVKIVVLAAAAILVPLPIWLRTGIVALVAGVALMLTVFVPLAHRWRAMRMSLLAQPTAFRYFLAHLASWGEHFDAIRETHRVWRVSLLALGRKSIELLGIIAIQMAFGLDPSLSAAVLVLAALAIGTMMPVAPANIGVYEAVVFAAYRYVGVPAETALGLAVVQHVCFLLPTLATGYFTLTMRQLLPRLSRAT